MHRMRRASRLLDGQDVRVMHERVACRLAGSIASAPPLLRSRRKSETTCSVDHAGIVWSAPNPVWVSSWVPSPCVDHVEPCGKFRNDVLCRSRGYRVECAQPRVGVKLGAKPLR